ncbi:hypothetical protein WHR41_06829 [Cladosporium halotolerans]|uniref:YDG domain-containing protein n=1 Tax=Cladosporium halotolerans TaxID=1052096 RepID=A0AB34KIN5_9PEZI
MLETPRNVTNIALITTSDHLTSQAHWIRNTLDLQIAQSGPEALQANDLLDVDSFLRSLLSFASGVSLATLRSSRIHLAILDICGRATRWPLKVIERAEAVGAVWESRYGPLASIGWDIKADGWNDIMGKRESVVIREADSGRARRLGDLGFKPGDWWIGPLFAFYAGMIDSCTPQGGIVSDSKGAYAVFLTDDDEISASSAEKFVYRARNGDKGRYRLTAATIDSRHPVRILRSHTLRSFWAPRAGIRYEGLYKVASWSIIRDSSTDHMSYDITFKRLPSESSMEDVLQRPWTEEIEDYKEYKRVKKEAKDKREEALRKTKEHGPGVVVTASDGPADEQSVKSSRRPREDSAWDVYEDETAESPKGSVVVHSTRVVDGRLVFRELDYNTGAGD